MARILLLEDDPVLGRSLILKLEAEQHQVFWARDLKSAFHNNEENEVDIALLDINLPDGSGLDFLKSVRAGGSRLPMIMLTAKSDEDTVVEALQLGANDYVRKPFGGRELSARIAASLKESRTADEKLQFADVTLLPEQRRVYFEGKEIVLNRREYDILLKLVERAETVVTRESVLESINKDGEILDRTVDSHISHLRSRLKTAGVENVKITSVYGIGYRLEKIHKR